MNYKIKEMYHSFQGEGAQTGRPAVFLRFSGCNLWSGREEDRHKAICSFCDTDFWGTDGTLGGKYTLVNLVSTLDNLWPSGHQRKYVILTGGEPALQCDQALVKALQTEGWEVAIETNGTLELPEGIDWICVSPKAGTTISVLAGHELKLVYPQEGMEPEAFSHLDFEHFSLQPMDGPKLSENTQKVIDYCLAHPQWTISLQTHKYVGAR